MRAISCEHVQAGRLQERVPDEAQRKRNSERSATLRDFVRQEIWMALR